MDVMKLASVTMNPRSSKFTWPSRKAVLGSRPMNTKQPAGWRSWVSPVFRSYRVTAPSLFLSSSLGRNCSRLASVREAE